MSRTPSNARSLRLISLGKAVFIFFGFVLAIIVRSLRYPEKQGKLISETSDVVSSEDTTLSLNRTRRPIYDTPSFRIALPISVIFAGIIALNYFRLLETKVELLVETTDLSFTTPVDASTQNLMENLHLTDIGFGEASSIQVGSQAPVTPKSPFPLQLAKQPGTNSSLVLEQFNLPQASTLYLNVDPLANPSDKVPIVSENQIESFPVRLAHVNTALVRCGPPIGSFEVPERADAADCDYQLEIEVNGAENIEVRSIENLKLADGGLFISAAPYRNTARMLAFDFETMQERLRIASQVKIADISFLRVEEFSDATDTSYSIGTGIESGTLYLENLGGKEIQLRPGEDLSFKVINGGLRTVELGDETMSVQFSGSVDNLKTGERNLMPTFFEYFYENDVFKAILAALGGVITIIIALHDSFFPRDQRS